MIDCNVTENYLKERARLSRNCQIQCKDCLMDNCYKIQNENPQKAIEIVQQWSDTHPIKTYLSDFVEKYPNAEFDEDGTPTSLCPRRLGYVKEITCLYKQNIPEKCKDCWNRPLEAQKNEM